MRSDKNAGLAAVAAIALSALGCGVTKTDLPSSGPTAAPRNGGVTVGAASWRMEPSLLQARSALAAAFTRGRIYVIGGDDGNGPSARVETFDPATGAWSGAPPMNVRRAYHAAAAVGEQLFVFGGVEGCAPNAGDVSDVEMLSAAGTWMAAPSMPLPMCSMAASVVDGKVYLVGGYSFAHGPSGLMQVFDPSTFTWSTGPMLPSRVAAAGASAAGVLFVLGGAGASGMPTDEVSTYLPGTAAWDSRMPMPTQRYSLSAVGVGSRVFAVGGLSNRTHDEVEIFEEGGIGAPAWRPGPSLNRARFDLACVYAAGRIYAIGGRVDAQPLPVVESLVP